MPDDTAAAHEAYRADLLADLDDALAAGGPCAVPDAHAVPRVVQDRLDEDLAFLQRMQQLRPRFRSAVLPAQRSGPDTASTDRTTCVAQGSARYEILGLHAAGGIGRVWLARDAVLGRCVALKDLQPEKGEQDSLRSRFLREAQITGQLQHPGIVPVYELVSLPAATSEAAPEAFYTMRLIRGRSLAEAARTYHVKSASGSGSVLERIALLNAFISACNTVAYAHACGVIHRDLKGANIVLGDFGEVVVLDWGFAKVLDHWAGPPLADDPAGAPGPIQLPSADQTAAHPSLPGQLMGTPAYMAPEQASGRPEAVDERTDVFGLGAILFEILTGRPPFLGASAAEVLHKVRSESPPRPSEVQAGVPRALEAICVRALAHDRAERYPGVAELAREVQHWLADEPVASFPEPRTARLGRWARRHRQAVTGAAALLVTAAVAAVIGGIVLGEQRARVAVVRAEADHEQAVADARARAELTTHVYYQRIALAEREISAGNISRAIQYLSDCPSDRRGWEWNCLQRLCRADRVVLRGHTAAVSSVVFSPDGRLLASASHDRTIRIWDGASCRPLQTLTGHRDAVYALAFSPDGLRLASASWDKTARLWDPDTGEELRTFGPQEDEIYRLALSPDGKYLATATVNDLLRIWDVNTGQALVIRKEPQSFFGLAFSPTEPGVIATSHYQTIALWNYYSGAPIATLTGHHSFIKSIAFSPDGRLLASGTGDLLRGDYGEVRLWDRATGRSLFNLVGHTDPIYSLAFAPGGRYLASASQDKTVKLWDVKTGQEALTLRGHTDTVRSVAFSPQGNRLASASADATIRIWEAAPWSDESATADVRTLAHHSDRAAGAVFSPDGRNIASGGAGPALKVWDSVTGALRYSVAVPTWISTVAYSPDGKRLATGHNDGTARILNAATGKVLDVLYARELGPIHSVAFSPDGRRLAACGWWRLVLVWDIERRQPTLTLSRHSQPVLAVAFDPRRRHLVSAGYDQTAIVWDAGTGQPVRTLAGHTSRIQAVAFSPDGATLASASHDGTVWLWDTTTWEAVRVLHGHAAGVRGIAFSPDGTRLASAGDDWSVRLWSVSTGEELRTLRGHGDRVHSIAYSPDGKRLASASYDGSIKLWDVTPVAKE